MISNQKTNKALKEIKIVYVILIKNLLFIVLGTHLQQLLH